MMVIVVWRASINQSGPWREVAGSGGKWREVAGMGGLGNVMQVDVTDISVYMSSHGEMF